MESLIRSLKAQGVLSTPSIIRAFERMDRKRFLPVSQHGEATGDYPLPIGHGQTNSQPYTVAFMLEKLQPERGQKVLDIGYGSGWSTVLLATIIGPTGQVFGLERIPALAVQGAENIARAAVRNAIVQQGDGWNGWADHAPYDRIHVAAAASQIPHALLEQLAAPGRMVLPIGDHTHGFNQSLVVVEKDAQGTYSEERIPGFAFVPLVAGDDDAGYTDGT